MGIPRGQEGAENPFMGMFSTYVLPFVQYEQEKFPNSVLPGVVSYCTGIRNFIGRIDLHSLLGAFGILYGSCDTIICMGIHGWKVTHRFIFCIFSSSCSIMVEKVLVV